MRRSLLSLMVVGMIGLSACTADVPSAAPTVTTIAPTASEEAITPEPGSRLPGDCSDVLELSSIEALVPAPAAVEDWNLLTSSFSAAFEQVGRESCRWEAVGASPSLWFDILPDSGDAYAEYVGSADPTTSAAISTVGDDSRLSCYDHSPEFPGYVQCGFNFIVSGYWVAGAYEAWPSPVPYAELLATLESVLGQAAAGVASLGEPLPVWQPPQHLVGDGSCESLDPTAAVGPAMGGSLPFLTFPSGGPEDALSINFHAYELSGAAGCTWYEDGGEFSMSVHIVAGSGWAWDLIDHGPRTAVDVPGSASAYRWFAEYQDAVEILVGESIVSVTYNPRTDAAAARAIAGATALLPGLPLEP